MRRVECDADRAHENTVRHREQLDLKNRQLKEAAEKERKAAKDLDAERDRFKACKEEV